MYLCTGMAIHNFNNTMSLSSSSSAYNEVQAQTKKGVTFDKSITIQEYPIILGGVTNHPT